MKKEISKCCGARACWNFCFKYCDKCGKRFEPKTEEKPNHNKKNK